MDFFSVFFFFRSSSSSFFFFFFFLLRAVLIQCVLDLVTVSRHVEYSWERGPLIFKQRDFLSSLHEDLVIKKLIKSAWSKKKKKTFCDW